MLEIMIMFTAYLCVFLLWLLKCLELKQVKEHCKRLSDQNDALWEIVKHLAELRLNIEPEENEE